MVPLDVPARLIFEVVVTLGVSVWAWSLASASHQSPARWSSIAMAGSFTVHRVIEWLVSLVDTSDAAFDSTLQLWAVVSPVLGSVVVFVAAPLVLGSLIQVRPPKHGRRDGSKAPS